MLILEICLGLAAYILIGNGLGHIMVREFLDKTKTEKLNWSGKLRRILLFPVALAFGTWEERANNFRDLPIWNYLTEYRQFLTDPDRIEKGKNGYIALHTWLWPFLRLIPAFFGVFCVIIKTGLAIAQGLTLLISNCFFRNERVNIGESIEAKKIRIFIQKSLEPKMVRFKELIVQYTEYRNTRLIAKAKWTKLIQGIENEQKLRIAKKVISELDFDIKNSESELERLSSESLKLDQLASSLDQDMAVLNLCTETAGILSNSLDGYQIRQEADEILTSAQESMRLVSEISEIPRNRLMVEMEIRRNSKDPVEFIDSQVLVSSVESEKVIH